MFLVGMGISIWLVIGACMGIRQVDRRLLEVGRVHLDIKDDVIFVYILRGKKLIFPKGNDTIEPGDRVVIATTILFFDDLEDVLN